MITAAKISIVRSIGLLAVMLTILLAGTLGAAKVATDYLLYQSATTNARSWAGFLARSITDLQQIAAGELPSAASMAFLESAQKSDQVYRYEIFNREGFSQLVADHDKIEVLALSDYSAAAASSGETGRPVVEAKEGKLPAWPSYYARAYVPIVLDGAPIAVVAAYVDQTQLRDHIRGTFLVTAASLCLLSAFSFGIPAAALYRRTQEKLRGDQRIRFLAHHDALTGLANRTTLIEALGRYLEALRIQGGRLAVHFIDLDRFKEVNDALGHDGGDCLLTTVAARLRAATHANDLVARLGGDEFVVLQPHVQTPDETEALARRLASVLAAPVPFNDSAITPTVSIGVAFAPTDGSDPERLLKSADLALYRAKADGRNCVRYFSPEMDAARQEHIALERLLRDAVLNERFALYYQPLFELSDRRLVGFEALIRLPKPDGTLVSPVVFIPLAEELKLIDKIGAWVLREACRTAATWPEHLTVAVNLSPAQFSAGGVSEVVAAALEAAGLAANRLELEITETVLLGNSKAIMAELSKLKAMGVAIAMDDFGTGYSSLSYLCRFPFDKIKIDRSFMQALDGSGSDAEKVVRTIVALGRELRMRVTVEGVETAKQAAFLQEVNGDQVQGFFFGRPVPATEVGAHILADWQRQHAANVSSGERVRLVK